jgi:hypothetical protein
VCTGSWCEKANIHSQLTIFIFYFNVELFGRFSFSSADRYTGAEGKKKKRRESKKKTKKFLCICEVSSSDSKREKRILEEKIWKK